MSNPVPPPFEHSFAALGDYYASPVVHLRQDNRGIGAANNPIFTIVAPGYSDDEGYFPTQSITIQGEVAMDRLLKLLTDWRDSKK